MDQLGYTLLYILQGCLILSLIYVGVWSPKEKMKGHAGRNKCKCCKKE